jgi:hypothetical protein
LADQATRFLEVLTIRLPKNNCCLYAAKELIEGNVKQLKLLKKLVAGAGFELATLRL